MKAKMSRWASARNGPGSGDDERARSWWKKLSIGALSMQSAVRLIDAATSAAARAARYSCEAYPRMRSATRHRYKFRRRFERQRPIRPLAIEVIPSGGLAEAPAHLTLGAAWNRALPRKPGRRRSEDHTKAQSTAANHPHMGMHKTRRSDRRQRGPRFRPRVFDPSALHRSGPR